MARTSGRIVFVDGFAGPGRYGHGEDGSPIVALRAALEHRDPLNAELVYSFVESDSARADNLEVEIRKLALPPKFRWQVYRGRFSEAVNAVLDQVDRSGLKMAPTFAFVDPFGWVDTPFLLVRRLLSNPRNEVMVNLMYEEINRFLLAPRQAENCDALFGTRDWRQSPSAGATESRREFVHDLYRRQLEQAAGAKFVRSFEMMNASNRTDYFLFFATNHELGLQKMKESMWKVDPRGEFQFSDATATGQPVLFTLDAEFTPLRRSVVSRFAGADVSVEDVERFVLIDTAYLPSHLRRHVLTPLESQRLIEVTAPSPQRRRRTFPAGTRLRFSGPTE